MICGVCLCPFNLLLHRDSVLRYTLLRQACGTGRSTAIAAAAASRPGPCGVGLPPRRVRPVVGVLPLSPVAGALLGAGVQT